MHISPVSKTCIRTKFFNHKEKEKEKEKKDIEKKSLSKILYSQKKYIKMISTQKLISRNIDYIKKNSYKVMLRNKSNMEHSIKFGLNSIIKYTNKIKDNNKILIFIFYKENMESLYDLLLLKNKDNKNIKIIFIDDEYNKEFVDLFKIKSCMGFLIIKIQNNEKVFNEIETNLSQYIIDTFNNDK